MPPELTLLLRDTSRSFYLTVRVLPKAVREPIGLAYLLARATDTVADTDPVPAASRIAVLEALRERLLGRGATPPELARFTADSNAGASPAERALLARVGEAAALLDNADAADRADIRWVLEVIIGGQLSDLHRFGGAAPGVPIALPDAAAVDDYTYRVAGCVGEFWSRLTRRRLFPSRAMDEREFLADGRRFGQGLQLVNILRDVPRDLRNGRCYFPGPALAAAGLRPEDLLNPASEPLFRPVYDAWLGKAADHLEAGWRHVNALPPGAVRLRLAEAWPVLLGARTLALLRTGAVLDPARRIKVSRRDVRGVMLNSIWRLAWPAAWRGQWASALGLRGP